MNFKRIISGLVGFPIAALVFLFANVYVMDVVVGIIAGISLHEYMKCFKVSKKAKPIAWISYLSCVLLPLLHVIPNGYIAYTIGLAIPFDKNIPLPPKNRVVEIDVFSKSVKCQYEYDLIKSILSM